MTWRLHLLLILFFGSISQHRAQHLYYKSPDQATIMQFRDSARRVTLVGIDSNDVLRHQFDYILKFYPKMVVKKIYVSYGKSKKPVTTRPTFGSIFKAPSQRVYKIVFSRHTNSTLDSVLLQNLSFNAQLGLIANQVSQVEDFSTDGFFDMFGWWCRSLYRKGRNKNYLHNEEKTLEMGLGYQLLTLNRELENKLRIENWTNTNGYTRYARQMRNQPMRTELILNFIGDLPVYVGKVYK